MISRIDVPTLDNKLKDLIQSISKGIYGEIWKDLNREGYSSFIHDTIYIEGFIKSDDIISNQFHLTDNTRYEHQQSFFLHRNNIVEVLNRTKCNGIFSDETEVEDEYEYDDFKLEITEAHSNVRICILSYSLRIYNKKR